MNLSKKYIRQFLPKKLEEFSKSKSFTYKDKKLKSSYVIDLIHNLIFKHFYTKEINFTLSSVVLKEKYGYQYNYYIDYLVDQKILTLIKNYQSGKNSRVYQLDESLLKNKIIRFKNYDKILIKKRKNYLFHNTNFTESPIDKSIREKLIKDLHSITVDEENALEFLYSFEEDKNVLDRNLLTLESIVDKDLFYHFDNYGRLHTNFTILKSFIRKNFLRIDGEDTIELDIKNSQPLFLNKVIKNIDGDLFQNAEFMTYGNYTFNGEFYNFLQREMNIDQKKVVKDIVYKIFFGKNNTNRLEKQFKKIFPSIYDFIKYFKKNNKDYKSLSHELQKLESDFIFNKVIKKIYSNEKDIKILTCHDSIICKKSDYTIVSDIFNHFIEKEFDFLKSNKNKHSMVD